MRAVVLAMGGALAVHARAAHADATARLAWVRADGAEQCPDTAAVQTAVNTRAGRRAIADDGVMSVEAIVRAGESAPEPGRGGDAARWRAQVFVRNAAGVLVGRRDLTSSGRECGQLVDLVAFAIVVALDADGGPPTPTVSSPSPPPATPSPAPSGPLDDERPPPVQTGSPVPPEGTGIVRLASPPARPVTPRPTVQTSFGLRIAASVGLQPAVSAGGSAVIDVTPLGWPTLRAVLAYWPESDTAPGAIVGTERIGVRYDLASLLVCPTLVRVEGLRIEACGGITAGVLTGVGHGFTMNAITDAPFFAPEVGIAARQAIGPIYLEAGVDAAVPLPHYQVTVTDLGAVWSPSLVVGQAFAGGGVVFR